MGEAEGEEVAEVLLQAPDLEEEGVGIAMLLCLPIPMAAIPVGVPITPFLPTYQIKYQPCKRKKKGG